MVSSGREGGLGVGSYATLPRVSIGSWAFAFGPYASHPWSFSQVCGFVAKAGYDGVEINGFRPHPHFDDFLGRTNVEVLKTEIADFGLGVSAYAPDFHHVPPARVVKDSLSRGNRQGSHLLRTTWYWTPSRRHDHASPGDDVLGL